MNENIDKNNERDEVYEVSLNRFFVFIYSGYKAILITSAFYIIAALCMYLAAENRYAEYVLLFPIYFTIALITKYFSYPKYFDVTSTSVRIRYNKIFISYFGSRRIIGEDEGDNEYYINNIEYIKYSQNEVEKRFNVGRITIKGNVVRSNSPLDVKPECRTFNIYGIKDFKNTVDWLLEYVVTKEKSERESLTH